MNIVPTESLEKWGAQTAISYRRGLRVSRWSYAELARTAYRFARCLEANHIDRGGRVLLWGENSAEWVAAFFGCLARGAIVVPLDVDASSEFVARVHRQVQPRLLVASSATRARSTLRVETLLLDDLTERVAGYDSSPYSLEEINESDIAEIIFTSGTTAEPKGVCLTHRNILANLKPLRREIDKYIKWERFVHPIRFMNLLPLSHVFGQFMGIFVPQILGGQVFYQESLNPSEIIQTIKKERISVCAAVPRQLETLRNKIERDYEARGKLDRLREQLKAASGHKLQKRWWVFRSIHKRFGWKFWAFVSGGAALAADTEEFWQRLGFAVVQGYGMTETAALISVNHPFKSSRGSIGKRMPGQEMKLDESGEILVRGENVADGYWGERRAPIVGEDGWLRTGDVGEVDAAGNLFFRGRKKDVIVTAAGLNIYPDDLEKELKRQPEIRDASVIGFEGAQGSEPLAVLILNDDKSSPAAAIERANRALAGFQRIRRWHVWTGGDFPRTPTQKVLKREVSRAVIAGLNARQSVERRSTLAEIVSRISGEAVAEVAPAANLSIDLKLDSLGRVELLSAIEDRYQVDIDEAQFTSATTVADIEKIIREGAGEAGPGYSYPYWAARPPVTWLRLVVFYLVMLPLASIMCRVRARGKERLGDLDGPALFISNHVAIVDQSLILSALPGRFRRRLAIAMEGERLRAWRHPSKEARWFTGARLLAQYALVVSLVNVFPLPQKSGFRRSFGFAGEMIDRGYSVLVFPEGKRTETGEMSRFREGTGLLAANLGVPVVPIKIEGLFELKRRRRYFARPGTVSITFGEPVKFERNDDPAVVTRELERRVASL